jgi:hypothetical protein
MFGDHRGSQVMSLHLKPRFSVFQFSVIQFSVAPRGNRPTVLRGIQVSDCLLLDLHAIILAAFGFEGEHSFRFSRCVPCYLNSDDRFQPLALETWLSQLVPLDGGVLALRHRFGDVNVWKFALIYEGCMLSSYETAYPLCPDGERADIPRGMLPMRFDSYVASHSNEDGLAGPERCPPRGGRSCPIRPGGRQSSAPRVLPGHRRG